jgi:Family of unknown function (DUF5677)
LTYFAQGFLSEPFDDVRMAVREQYASWRSLLMQLNAQCVASQHEFAINPDAPRDLLGGTLFARTLTSTQASIILLEHGLLAQAKTVLRSALESLFALAAIEAKPELALPLAQSQEANKRSLADKVLQWKSVELKASRSAQIDEAQLREMASSRTRVFNTAQLADAAGMMDWYHSIYALLSFPVHASVSDLVSHLVTDGHGNVTELKNEPDVEGQEFTWALAIEIQIRAAIAVSGIFGNNTVDVQTHKDSLRALVSKLKG